MAGRFGLRQAALWAALCLGTWLLVRTSWRADGPHLAQTRPDAIEYYTRQTAGFAAGELAMQVRPHPRINYVASDGHPVPEPFLLDASFYKDRYYLYFGAAPILTVFLPVYLLTGVYLNESVVALLFMVLGFWASVAWVNEWRRHAAPRAPAWLWGLLVLALGLCTGALPSLMRSMFYEVAAASGYFWNMLALFACTRAIFRPQTRARWLVLAGLSVGLAGASRGTLLPLLILLPGLAAWCSWQDWRGGARGIRRLAGPWLAAGLPSAAVLLGLLAYNQARFGHLLEFGFRFQVNGMPPNMFSPGWVLHNLWYYYFAPPQLYPYFPFVAPVADLVRPEAYWSYEQAHGQAYAGPLVLLIAVAAAWVLRRNRLGPAAAAALGLAGVWFVVAFAPMAAAGVRSNRYMLDFQPVLLGLLIMGTLIVWRLRTRAARFVCGAAAAVLTLGIVFNYFSSLHTHGWFRDRHPGEYAALARSYDRLAWPILRHVCDAPGPRRATIVFPSSSPPGAIEPLVVASIYAESDAVLFQQTGPGRGRFVFEHAPYGQVNGPDFSFTPGKPCDLELQVGFLYPPVGHPWWRSRPEAEQQQLLNSVRVLVDGAVRLDLQAPCYSVPPNRLVWGERDRVQWAEPRFGGQLSDVRRMPVDTTWLEPRRRGDRVFQAELLLPRDRFGSQEPLASIGLGPDSEMLSIEYVHAGRIRFVRTVPGQIEYSSPVDMLYEHPHRFLVEPTTEGASPEKFGFRVWVDGTPVWSVRSMRVNGHSLELVPLSNTQRRGPARHLFGGETRSIEYVAPPAIDSVKLPAVPLPEAGQSVPLFSVDRSDHHAVLALQRRDAHTAELLWSSGTGTPEVSTLPLDAEEPAAFELTSTADEWSLSRNHEQVWSRKLEARPADPWRLHFWTDTRTGTVSPVALVPVWKPTALKGEGPFRLRVRFPKGRDGHAEPLAVTGTTGAGDCVYVRYLGPDTISIGADHWGIGGPASPPVHVDFNADHEVWISMGSLQRVQPASPDAAGTRVWLDGREVLAWPQPTHTTDPGTLELGANPIGISTCETAFTGKILEKSRQPAPPEAR